MLAKHFMRLGFFGTVVVGAIVASVMTVGQSFDAWATQNHQACSIMHVNYVPPECDCPPGTVGSHTENPVTHAVTTRTCYYRQFTGKDWAHLVGVRLLGQLNDGRFGLELSFEKRQAVSLSMTPDLARRMIAVLEEGMKSDDRRSPRPRR